MNFLAQRTRARLIAPNRSWVTLGVVTAALVATGVLLGEGNPRAAMADELAPVALTPASPDQQISLRDRLIAGLKARLESEIEFIDAVVAAVDDGDLPPRLVDQTYFWARQRSKRSRDARFYRPIIYFQIAMRIRAAKLGVEL